MVSAKEGVVLCQEEGREVGEALGADLGVEAGRRHDRALKLQPPPRVSQCCLSLVPVLVRSLPRASLSPLSSANRGSTGSSGRKIRFEGNPVLKETGGEESF